MVRIMFVKTPEEAVSISENDERYIETLCPESKKRKLYWGDTNDKKDFVLVAAYMLVNIAGLIIVIVSACE